MMGKKDLRTNLEPIIRSAVGNTELIIVHEEKETK